MGVINVKDPVTRSVQNIINWIQNVLLNIAFNISECITLKVMALKDSVCKKIGKMFVTSHNLVIFCQLKI